MSLPDVTKLTIVKLAAGAVIVLSVVGVAAITGLIPNVSSQEKPTAITETATVTPAPTPAEKPAPVKRVAREPATVTTAPIRQAKVAECFNCGVVQSVQTIEVKGEGSGLGAVAGGVAGIAVGNQIGNGKGRTLAKIAGAVGGAYAGHQIERNIKKSVQYEITVRMDDGSHRTITQTSDNGLGAGDHVKVIDGMVVRG